MANKKIGGKEYPSSAFMVVEDSKSPDTWHLRVKDGNGNISPRLLGAAHAALTVGFRGNKYIDPNKEEALTKLKRLYRKAGLKWPESKEGAKKRIALVDL